MKTILEVNLWDLTPDTIRAISDSVTPFSDTTINTEMQRQASVYSYYYGLMAEAKRRVDSLERDLSRLSAVIRSGHREASTKKLTAKDLDDLVLSDETYLKASSDVEDAELIYELLKGLVRALEQKKDMLIQASSNQRAEQKLYN